MRSASKQADISEIMNVRLCYQCKTCTLSCPFAAGMDYLPHQIIRKVQLVAIEEVLSSRTIWYCASCETCAARCPNEINITRVMDTLRQMVLQENTAKGSKNIPVFHRLFLGGVGKWGRQYELGLLLAFKLKTRDLFSDLRLGIKMLGHGKLALLPKKNPGGAEIKNIYRKLKWIA